MATNGGSSDSDDQRPFHSPDTDFGGSFEEEYLSLTELLRAQDEQEALADRKGKKKVDPEVVKGKAEMGYKEVFDKLRDSALRSEEEESYEKDALLAVSSRKPLTPGMWLRQKIRGNGKDASLAESSRKPLTPGKWLRQRIRGNGKAVASESEGSTDEDQAARKGKTLFQWLSQGVGRRKRFLGPVALAKLLMSKVWKMPHVTKKKIPMAKARRCYDLPKGSPKIESLSQNYSSVRPVLGDGDCFYRSFIFSYLEQVLDRADTDEEDRLLGALETVAAEYKGRGWDYNFAECYEAFKDLIENVRNWKGELSESSYREMRLLKFFGGYRKSEASEKYAPHVAVTQMCAHSEDFAPYHPRLTAHYDLEELCRKEIIPLHSDSDHIDMMALAVALGVPLRVVDLHTGHVFHLYSRPGSPSAAGSSSTPSQPVSAERAPVPRVTLLYTGNHYDIIYPRS